MTKVRVFGLPAIFLTAFITGNAPQTAEPATQEASVQTSSGGIEKNGRSLTEGLWITSGFEGFACGVMGNAGQNLYVSRNGILQRIHQYDWNQDGYPDVVICNSHDYWEKPDTYVYREVFGRRIRQDLPSDGAVSGALHDLNGDGYADLVLAMKQNGTRADLNALIYFGDAEGMSERRRLLLPVPGALSVTAGDFNGDGRPDLAFARPESLRVFYQNDLTFEPKRYVERSVQAFQLTSADLDSDGFGDLFLFTGGGTRILWGGPSGISESNATEVTLPEDRGGDPTSGGTTPATESKSEFRPLPRCLVINDVPHLVVPQSSRVLFVPVSKDRALGNPVAVDGPRVVSAAVGDINGNGVPDLVFASRSRHGEHQASWICWDLKNGLEPARRTPLETQQACDVEIADLDSDNLDDVVICQDHGEKSSTFYSLIFRGSAGGTLDEAVQVESLSAQRVLVGRTSKTQSLDVIFVNREARGTTEGVDVALYLGGPDGFIADRRVDLPARSAVAAIGADINDDGRADLIIANCSEENTALDPGSFVYLAGNGGFPDRPSMKIPTARAHGTACADLNRDGYLDLVFVGFSNPEIQINYGDREGTFRETRFRMEADGQVYDEPRWPHLADLNRDGWLDLIVPQIAYDRSLVLWGGEEGFSMARRQMLSVWHGSFANAADLDGNGWIDPVIGGHIPSRDVPHDSFLHIYWNGPEGLREDRRTQLPGNGINAVGIRDFNNDAFLDIFVANYHDNRARDIDSHIYWGSRAGFSESRRQRLFSHSASGSNANDFNEDGWVDLAIANHKVEGDHVGFSSVWWNGPKGFSEERTTRLPSRGPHGMTVIDPGNQVDRGPEEFYLSAPFELPGRTRVTRAECEAEIPAKTWVRLQLRFAASRTELENAPWLPDSGSVLNNPGRPAETQDQGRWVQYRLVLGSSGGGRTPRVREVRLKYE